ncbi:MAG: glycosyltransferase [Ferruginibacter sp.]
MHSQKKAYYFSLQNFFTNLVQLRQERFGFLNTDDQALFIENKIIPSKKSFVLPGEGIDTHFFKSEIPTHKNGVTTFLLVSRMLYDKGVKVFVEASDILLKKGYSISSLLVGQIDLENPEGIPNEKLAQWQKDGLVKYLGPTADVKPFIENADCIVLPSYYKEGMSRVLLEAACMERPIITTQNPGCKEIVDDGINGYLCDVKKSYITCR